MSDGTPAIWTPDGVHTLGGKRPERVELTAGLMEWLRQFADVAQYLKLTIVCSRCKTDLVGKNAEHDLRYYVTCHCREFVGKNRDFRVTPPTGGRAA